jgi:energy-coupling factor transport system ATP-binding protein
MIENHDDVVVKLENVSFTYKTESEPTVKNINLEVKKGEFIGLIGPTGSGKTTLLNLIAGVLPFYYEGNLQGTVYIKGQPTTELSMAELSRQVGLVMQDPESQLFNLYVRDEVIWGLENLGVSREKIAAERDRVLNFFGISHLFDRVTYDLSGGEKQKVALTSSYIMSPELFLFDNPTSELDPLGSAMVFSAIQKLAKEESTTVIVNEDKVEELAAHADRLWLIKDGQILLDDKPRQFFAHKDVLAESLIRVPPVTEIAYRLRELGYEIPELPLTVEETLEIYERLMKMNEAGGISGE